MINAEIITINFNPGLNRNENENTQAAIVLLSWNSVMRTRVSLYKSSGESMANVANWNGESVAWQSAQPFTPSACLAGRTSWAMAQEYGCAAGWS